MNEEVKNALLNFGFKLEKSEVTDYYKIDLFRLNGLLFRIIQDRNEELAFEFDRKSLFSENYYDIELVKALLESKPVSLEQTINSKKLIPFLEQHLKRIEKLYSRIDYRATIKKLEELGNERARLMFPRLDL